MRLLTGAARGSSHKGAARPDVDELRRVSAGLAISQLLIVLADTRSDSLCLLSGQV
jgi:hypothetical protein